MVDKKNNFPKNVILIEVGPRDGFQSEKKIVPTWLKIEIILSLIEAGLKNIQIASFVNPEKIPQMADASELLKLLPENKDVNYSALSLNLKGVEKAFISGVKNIEISISSSNTHSLKNTGMPFKSALEEAKKMIRLAKAQKMNIRAGIQCAFGCVYEGEISHDIILKIVNLFLNEGVDMLSLSDTTGMATPFKIKKIIEKLDNLTQISDLSFHLHDTRGLGLVNVVTALHYGISNFDTSFGGIGGCPFVKGAAGNIPTEDTAYLLESLDIKTGLDISKIALCSKKMEDFFEKKFPSKFKP